MRTILATLVIAISILIAAPAFAACPGGGNNNDPFGVRFVRNVRGQVVRVVNRNRVNRQQFNKGFNAGVRAVQQRNFKQQRFIDDRVRLNQLRINLDI